METKKFFFLVQDFLNNFFGNQYLIFHLRATQPKFNMNNFSTRWIWFSEWQTL